MEGMMLNVRHGEQTLTDAQLCMRAKYRHMGTVVRALPTCDMTRVFRCANEASVTTNVSSQLFFPWLGMNASEFGIGKVMCSLLHASSVGSRQRQRNFEKKQPTRKADEPAAAENVTVDNEVLTILVEPASVSTTTVRRSNRLKGAASAAKEANT